MGEVSSGKNEQFAIANGPFIDDLPIKHFFHNYVKLPESNQQNRKPDFQISPNKVRNFTNQR
jgi:kynurenine formamidase